jgi:hypothetical protein
LVGTRLTPLGADGAGESAWRGTGSISVSAPSPKNSSRKTEIFPKKFRPTVFGTLVRRTDPVRLDIQYKVAVPRVGRRQTGWSGGWLHDHFRAEARRTAVVKTNTGRPCTIENHPTDDCFEAPSSGSRLQGTNGLADQSMHDYGVARFDFSLVMGFEEDLCRVVEFAFTVVAVAHPRVRARRSFEILDLDSSCLRRRMNGFPIFTLERPSNRWNR